MKLLVCFAILLWCLGLTSPDQGVFGVDTDEVSVIEGDSVTLNTGVLTKHQDTIRWYFNDTLIARINGEQSKICTDVQCNKGTERFRDRLKLDHQTGSLTITNTKNADAGVYHLKISSGRSESEKIFIVTIRDGVFVMEGDSVTLNTGVQTDQDRIRWYFNDSLIVQINGKSETCTDVQCNEGNERFRDRLKLDHQTGSLTITNITNTHSGEYHLKIISSDSSDSEQIFSVTVRGVSAAERNKMKKKSVKEGESVTFDPGVGRKQNDSMTWYFNDTLIAEISGDQSKICTDVQCDERFRDRLKLDHQTGSLIITNTRNTDSGEYKIQIIINNSSFSIFTVKRFSLTIIGSGLSSDAVAGIAVGVVVLLVFVAAAVGVIYYRRRSHTAVPQNDPNGIPLRRMRLFILFSACN